MILQACASDRTIRQVAIAIAALDLTLTAGFRGQDPGFAKSWRDRNRLPPPGCVSSSDHPALVPLGQRSLSYRHHQFALEQYDRAIKKMRENIMKGSHDMRSILITCIVTTCFEVMHGNYDAACTQLPQIFAISSSTEALFVCSSPNLDASHNVVTEMRKGPLTNLESGVQLFQDWKAKQPTADKHPLGFSSPEPIHVDDFLVQTFGRMEIQSMSFCDNRTLECHKKLLKEGLEVISSMPTKFATLEQARIYIDLIMRRLLHLVGTVTRSFIKHTFNAEGIMGEYGAEYNYELVSAAKIRSESVQLYGESLRWSFAFADFLKRVDSPTVDKAEKVAILTMNVAAIASRVCSGGTLAGMETRYDPYLEEFRIIVAQSTTLLALQHEIVSEHEQRTGSNPSFVFSFELGVVTPLSIVTLKCRNQKLRREALELLNKYPRREGVWDSVITAAVSRWAMSLEEEWGGLEDPYLGDHEDFIPEEKRIRNVGVKYDLPNKRVVMSCLQFEDGEWVERVQDYRCETWRLDNYFGCYSKLNMAG